ncbi:MAG: hypothetical protein ACR2F6_16295 [Mycobacteriales bacterium]
MTDDVDIIETIGPTLTVPADGRSELSPPASRRAADWLNRRGGVLTVAIGFGLIGGFTRSFTSAPYMLLGGALVAVVIAMVGNRERRLPRPPAPARRGYVVWGLIVAFFSSAEIGNVVLGSGRDHPSLSVLMDPVINSYPGRATALFVWVWAGIELVRR